MRGWRWALASREPQLRVGSAEAGFRQTELAADDVGALHERNAFVEGDAPRQALAAEAAIGADHELLLGNVLQRLAYQRRDVLRRLHHRVAVVDDPDADLLVGLDVLEEMQVLPIRAGAFDRQDIAIELQEVRQ